MSKKYKVTMWIPKTVVVTISEDEMKWTNRSEMDDFVIQKAQEEDRWNDMDDYGAEEFEVEPL